MINQTKSYKKKYLGSGRTSNLNQTDRIRVLIVDDSGVIREGLKVMLEAESDFDIVGMANNGEAAIELVEQQHPNVVLMDMEMPKLNGLDSTKIIHQQFLETKVIVFSSHEEDSYISQSLEAQAKLESTEVRPVDLQLAPAELEQANSNVEQVWAALALTEVRSPIDGRVLKVNVRSSEAVGDRSIAEIAKTDQMYVVAEVSETDLEKISLGQKASITSSAFSGQLEGEVSQVGLEVKRQDDSESDLLVNIDNNAAEVKIRLDPRSSQRATALSNSQVQAVIDLRSSQPKRML